MFDWLFGKSKCPVEQESKLWIETRFAWLTDEFGIDRLKDGKTVTPTEQFLPARYRGSEEEIVGLMTRMAGYMDLDPNTLQLSFFSDTVPGGDGGHSVSFSTKSETHYRIWLEENSLEDPGSVVALLIHEIGRILLIHQDRIDPEESDQHELINLLAVFLGVGIFPANAALQETSWSEGLASGWSSKSLGYLSMDMYGYAMALYSLARYDPNPEWAIHLRADVRGSLKRGIRYVRETKDCEFLPARDGAV